MMYSDANMKLIKVSITEFLFIMLCMKKIVILKGVLILYGIVLSKKKERVVLKDLIMWAENVRGAPIIRMKKYIYSQNFF